MGTEPGTVALPMGVAGDAPPEPHPANATGRTETMSKPVTAILLGVSFVKIIFLSVI